MKKIRTSWNNEDIKALKKLIKKHGYSMLESEINRIRDVELYRSNL